MKSIAFRVLGLPAPGGSKKAFFRPGMKYPSIVEDCERNKPWRDSVTAAALEAMSGQPPMIGPLYLKVTFNMPRPKGHHGSGKNAGKVRESAPPYPAVKPDATKLLRSTEDALAGIIWRDDAQVVTQHVEKVYGAPIGAMIEVFEMN